MYSGLRDRHRWVLPDVLREQARKHPGNCWIEMTDGGTLTFGQADTEVSRVAGFLRHQLESCGAALAVVDRDRLDVLRSIGGGLTHLRRIIVIDAENPLDTRPFEAIDWSAWRSAISYEGASPRPQDSRLHHAHIRHQRALEGRSDAAYPLLPVRPRCD